MPELPEMQALAERLDSLLAGAALQRATPLQFAALKTFEPRPDALTGDLLRAVGRRGKYLVFALTEARVIVHLSQGGRVFLEEESRSSRPKGGVVRLAFEGRPSVLIKEFGSQRKAAWWVLGGGDQGPLQGLGPEPGSAEFEQRLLRGTEPRRIHTLLRDQRWVAGIGRGFTDDILWRARLSPYASLDGLSQEVRRELLSTVRTVLDEGLARERRRRGGLPAKLGDRFEVHGRWGHPCPRCGDDLRRVSYESYEITYCPSCQTEGRMLADRRMSRLVK
jgi:formamidopyrimidine-DNA glycosylase